MRAMGIRDTLLGRNDKQMARKAKARADFEASKDALRSRVHDEVAQTRADWEDTKAKAARQSRGQDA